MWRSAWRFSRLRSRGSADGRNRRRSTLARPVEWLEDRTLLTISMTGVPQWLDQGPSPIENGPNTNALPQHTGSEVDDSAVGAIESVVVAHVTPSSTNPGGYIVYAGTVNGGVWRTDNLVDGMIQVQVEGPGRLQGQLEPVTTPDDLVWRPLTDQQPSLAVSSLALDPLDFSGNTLWVGTGSLSSDNNGGGPSVGLLKTTDGGQTWTNPGRSALAGSPVMAIAMSLGVYKGRFIENPVVASLGSGVLYTQDGGQTFQTGTIVDGRGKKVGTMSGSATDVVADPGNPSAFFATLTGKGIYRSLDGGATWTRIDGYFAPFAGGGGFRLAAADSGGAITLYAVALSTVAGTEGSYVTGIYRSTNPLSTSSPTWSEVGVTPTDFTADIGQGQLALTADPTNPDVVYVSGLVKSIYRVDASDGSWTPLDQPSAFSGSSAVPFPTTTPAT